MSRNSEPTVGLRPMVEDDLKSVLIIEAQSYPEPWKETHFKSELARTEARCLVLTDDETDSIIVGYMVYWIQAEGISLLNVTVDPNWRGFGFGFKLMQAMIREAVHEDLPKIILEVRESNQAAIRLYESIGFKTTHTRKSFYSNGESARVMEIKTSEASGVLH